MAGSGAGQVLRSGWTTIVLALLAVLLLVALSVLWWHGRAAAAPSTAGSPVARAAALREAGPQVERVLSYDWRSFDRDRAAEQSRLAPAFRGQYAATMDRVRATTLRDHVRVTVSAVGTGVVSASSDRVVALVYVNQVTTASGRGNQRLDQNRVLVTLTRHDGPWRVAAVDAF